MKKSYPIVYKIFPIPPQQNRYFYREELFKVDKHRLNRSDIPIEKVLSWKSLPTGEKIFQCSLIGADRIEWLTLSSLKNRFILFPNSTLSTALENFQKSSNHPTTRSQRKGLDDAATTGVITRSKSKL